jgi:hypothetical protein
MWIFNLLINILAVYGIFSVIRDIINWRIQENKKIKHFCQRDIGEPNMIYFPCNSKAEYCLDDTWLCKTHLLQVVKQETEKLERVK